jgi:hypothetical protein
MVAAVKLPALAVTVVGALAAKIRLLRRVSAEMSILAVAVVVVITTSHRALVALAALV